MQMHANACKCMQMHASVCKCMQVHASATVSDNVNDIESVIVSGSASASVRDIV